MKNIFSDIFYINEKGINQYNVLINGCWRCINSNKTMEVFNPYNGEVVGIVPDCNKDDVKYAIESAKNAQNLSNFKLIERLEIMKKAGDLLEEYRETLAKIITLECGKPIKLARSEVDATIERFFLTMQEINVLHGEYLPGELVKDTQNKFAILIRKPLGIVAAISPFNYPLFIPASKIIPAILAGNNVIAKPSSDTPLSLIYLVRILQEAGMPAGTINIITGSGREVGDAIIESPDIQAISFTGSTKIGENIAKKAGIKKLHLELGGKAAAIVLEDANIEKAAKLICRGTYRNSGQRCDAVSRVLIDKKVKDRFIEKVIEETKNYIVGDPFDEKTDIGTIINKKGIEKIDQLVQDAKEKGAEILIGGYYKDLVYYPTVIDKVTLDMRIAWEEIFGPVMPIIEVNNYEEAIEISNRSEFGLDSCLFTENLNLALKISKKLDDGSVTINSIPAHGVGYFPFGGNKLSGLGREGLMYSIDELTKLHTIIFTEE